MTIIKTFVITENHLKLLRSMNVSWNHMESGAPTIDPKRPYGNSDVYVDICKILNFPIPDFDNDEDFTDEQLVSMDQIHEEMETVLQIVLRVGFFKEGIYMADFYGRDWKKVYED